MYYEEENRTERIVLIAAIGMGVAAIVIFVLAMFILIDPLGMRTPPPPEPTRTPTFTPLPTWTNTPTRTATPTRTPAPTDTPTPVPTPVPTETPTRVPTRRPPPPTPVPYQVGFKGALPDCTQVRIEGWVRDTNGFTIPGVAVHVWSDRGHDATLVTDNTGHYEIFFLGPAIDYQGWWHVQVVENGRPASPIERLPISADCINAYQKYRVDWVRIR